MAHDNNWRRRVYQVLEQGPVGEHASVWVDRLLVALIIVNLVAVALQSVPAIEQQYARLFSLVEYVSLVVFTVEYLAAAVVAVEHGPAPPSVAAARAPEICAERRRHRRPHRRAAVLVRLRAAGRSARALVFRIVRFFKIARYSPAMRSLLDVLYRERRALFGCLVIALGTALVAAALDASRRGQGAARQARHHPRRVVVGDRHHRHHRLRRRGAGDRARQADRRPPPSSSA